MTLRLLANENIPSPSIQRLKDLGFEVLSVRDVRPGAPDIEVMELARREDRIVLTFDRDYGELVFRRQLPPPSGLIYLRFIPENPLEPALVVSRFLHAQPDSVIGHFIVLTRETVRLKAMRGNE